MKIILSREGEEPPLSVFFLIHGAGNVSLQLGDLVGHPPHGQGPGGVTGPGGTNYDEEAPAPEN